MNTINNIYQALDRIQKLITGKELCTGDFSKVRNELDYVKEKINVSDVQAALFAIIVELSSVGLCSAADLADQLGISNCLSLTYANELYELELKHLLMQTRERFDGHRQLCYYVPTDVLTSLSKNEKFESKVPKCTTNEELFFGMDILMKACADGELPISLMEKEMDDVMTTNCELPLAKGLLKYKDKLAKYEYITLVLMTLYWIKGNNEVTASEIKFVFEDRRVYQTLSQELMCGTSNLLKLNVVEFVNNNGLASRSTFTVTSVVKKETYPKLLTAVKDSACLITKSSDIVAKDMFYNEKEQEQISILAELLKEKRFRQVQKRLTKSGMRSGFTVLFYGVPGSGKTETVLQLARMTGRDVMQVQFSQMRNAYVGESEKAVERVFNMYKRAVKESTIAPILLIDECDGMMSKRLTNLRDSVDKMENSIQNIILQEMSAMDGICICTTNLTENLDPAMSRRLLYKVRFEKPCTKAKASIWRSMIPDLSDLDAMTLAMNYDFSGGQIENIARKKAVDSILFGGTMTIKKIREYCDAEEISTDGAKKIGF